MLTTTVTDPFDNKYRFGKALFDDPNILYHGTWSAYTHRIDEGDSRTRICHFQFATCEQSLMRESLWASVHTVGTCSSAMKEGAVKVGFS